MNYQSIEEVRASGKTFLTPEQASVFCGIAAQTIRIRAISYPEKLGFPVFVTGKGTKKRPWVRIPTEPFLLYVSTRNTMKGGKSE